MEGLFSREKKGMSVRAAPGGRAVTEMRRRRRRSSLNLCAGTTAVVCACVAVRQHLAASGEEGRPSSGNGGSANGQCGKGIGGATRWLAAAQDLSRGNERSPGLAYTQRLGAGSAAHGHRHSLSPRTRGADFVEDGAPMPTFADIWLEDDIDDGRGDVSEAGAASTDPATSSLAEDAILPIAGAANGTTQISAALAPAAADPPVPLPAPAPPARRKFLGAVVEVYENEAWGWGLGALGSMGRPTGGAAAALAGKARPPRWSYRDGSAALAPGEVLCPDDWEWASEWHFDRTGCRDRDGWEYASGPGEFGGGGGGDGSDSRWNQRGRKGRAWADGWRRRRWVRAMRPIAGSLTAAAAAVATNAAAEAIAEEEDAAMATAAAAAAAAAAKVVVRPEPLAEAVTAAAAGAAVMTVTGAPALHAHAYVLDPDEGFALGLGLGLSSTSGSVTPAAGAATANTGWRDDYPSYMGRDLLPVPPAAIAVAKATAP
ncbi:unnamed protein product, partial [Phaeothamnion confervicola]